MAKLTVIIPLYNQEQYIAECLDSIISQTYQDIEIIVVDDGSTDGGLKICQNLAQKDERIKIIHQENKGSSGARCAGLRAAKTKYVTFVDADDFILEDAYVYADEAMYDDVDMISFEITRYYSENHKKQEYVPVPAGYYNQKQIEECVYPLLIWNFDKKIPGLDCSLCTRIVKTELLLHEYNRLADRKFYYGDDAAITYPLYLQIKDMQVIDKSYYMHRQRVTGVAPYIVSDNFFEEATKLYNYLRERLVKHLEKCDLKRQIEYYYMYSIERKKMAYGDYEYHRDFLFPFDKVERGKKIVLYGAGEVGKAYYKQLVKINYCESVLWIDKNALHIRDDRVVGVEKIKDYMYDVIVIAIENVRICNQVKDDLVNMGAYPEKIIF